METLARAANRGSVSTGYDIENSLKLESDNNEHLYRAMANGNRRTWTYSCWIKRTELLQSNSQVLIHFGVNHQVTRMFIGDTNDHLYLDVCNTENELYRSITNRKFQDTAAWYHFVWRMDTTQSVAANRMKLYINGVEETSWSQHQLPPENYDTLANTTAGGYDDMGIGTFVWAGSSYDGLFSGYIAQVAHVDGQSYAPTEFGEFDDSGIWKPIDVSGLTYGTSNNSFFLDFETASDLGANAKGNDVNFSLSNISAADQATDTPTNNFCTLNPIFQSYGSNAELTISEGGTRAVNAASAYKSATSTIGVSTGKWYWEVNVTDRNTITTIGVTMPFYWNQGNLPFGGTVYYGQTGQRHNNSVAGGGQDSFGNGYTDGDIISFALDMDATTPTLAVRKNNSLVTGNNATGNLMYGLSLTGSGGTFLPPKEDFYFAKLVGYGANTFDINFGGYTAASISSAETDENGYGTFEYAPPTGYYALCTKNLAEYG